MSSLKRNLFLSVFGAAMSASVAFAADLPAPPIIEYEPEAPVEIGSGWYLRGDLGIAAYTGADSSWTNAFGTTVNFYDESFNHGWVAGVGAGYYFNDNLRTDVTVDYHGKVKHTSRAPCGGCAPSTETQNFSAWTLMLNGYYDFGNYHSITPYVGAGIGVAQVSVGDYTTTSGYVFGDNDQTNLAWNVMAGAAIDISHNVKLDANYRFMSFGKAQTGVPTTAPSENPIKFKDLYAHEFRLGLRYDLN